MRSRACDALTRTLPTGGGEIVGAFDTFFDTLSLNAASYSTDTHRTASVTPYAEARV